MALSYAELQQVVACLRPALAGGRLQDIRQPSETTVVLSFYADRQRRHLLIATEPRFARIHLVPDKPSSSGDVPPFARALRQTPRGARLQALELTPGDRVVELHFARRDGPAGRLIAELTGRTSNLISVAPSGNITAVLRPTGKSDRALHPGAAYEPPPPPPFAPKSARENRFADAANSPEGLSRAIQDTFAEAERQARIDSLRQSLTSRLKAERKRTGRLLDNLESDAASAEEADRLRLKGELLKLHLHEIPPHAETITVPNIFEPQAPEVEISLRPDLSPEGNMERYFRRYKKRLAARQQAQERLAKAQRRLNALDRANLAVQQAEDLEELESLADTVVPARRKQKKRRRPPGPWRFTSAEDLLILVGRTPRESEDLTFRRARGNDVWLHVEGYKGSHVIIRVPKGKSAPKETLLDAATLAVHYSELRKGGGGPVVYCAAKHVNKLPDAGPGRVLYSESKTLHVTVERSRMDRLMKTRE